MDELPIVCTKDPVECMIWSLGRGALHRVLKAGAVTGAYAPVTAIKNMKL